jgi:hypothetical protein
VLGGDDAVELVPVPGVSPEPRSTSVTPVEPRSTSVSDDLTQVDRGPEDLTQVDRTPSVEEETARLDRLEADLLDLKGEIARLREALGD